LHSAHAHAHLGRGEAMALFSVQRERRSGRFSPDRELSDIYTELWELDENRLTPDKHYRINLQGGQSGEL